ncbi:MAG: hypothetical protein JOZ54_17105 [Acidobacteria bacterium]|nr:hypothetical protein [Acidobacteriota bacterium]
MSVSTLEILMHRATQRSCGQECVDWAAGMIERGLESTSLLILAGMTSPFHSVQMSRLRDCALDEICAPELAIADPVSAYVAELLTSALHDPASLRTAFAKVTKLAIELGYPDALWPFYKLHQAATELEQFGDQVYWPGATAANIDEVLRKEARGFLAHAGPALQPAQ